MSEWYDFEQLGLIYAAKEAINVSDRNPPPLPNYRKEIMDTAFGTKILNRKDNSVGLLIKTWLNEYADAKIWMARCVDTNGKRYDIQLDEIITIEEV